MYQNQLSCQNSAIVQDPGYRWQYFPPWCSKERNFVPLQQGLDFTHENAEMIKLYLKNFSPRICANLFPWNTRRRRFTTASQPIGKLINHVQNLSFYFFDHVQNWSFYFFNHVQNLSFYFGFPFLIPHLVLVLTVQGGANFNGRPCLILRFLILSRSRHFTVSPSHCTNILWPLHSLTFQSHIS